MASAWRLCLGRLCLVVGACAAVAPAVVPARGPMIHLADGRSLRLLALELRGETTPLRCHVETATPSEPATPSELRGTAAPLRGDAEGARSAGGGAAGGGAAGAAGGSAAAGLGAAAAATGLGGDTGAAARHDAAVAAPAAEARAAAGLVVPLLVCSIFVKPQTHWPNLAAVMSMR